LRIAPIDPAEFRRPAGRSIQIHAHGRCICNWEGTAVSIDAALRERLVTDNLRLAYSFARRAHRPSMGALGVEDLEQEAVMGLMAAAAKYDIEEYPDVPFSTFARRYILRYIDDAASRWGMARLDPLVGDVPDRSTDSHAGRLELEVWDMLQCVPPRARPVLIRRYGLDGGPALGLLDLADHFGLPARSVGRLLAVGREVVRQECEARGFRFERWARAIAGKIA
jgi:RNA polymerase sigma factor (sigma-70 family)